MMLSRSSAARTVYAVAKHGIQNVSAPGFTPGLIKKRSVETT
ncbi:hypothetical protein AGR7A_Lc140016 [Agrobacterium deltaense NCPPB 1641]|uniref:Uncharacterized protein n=1 Tax=Agrobacterium deltaense NCPPB 1641 TaxID=1183425 RepID=A0A1S7U294_9HYPH|nr:hypothetical protein AGR7A_Lc140016 [Agrobacterium deltaense NCPPB 1641]